MTEYHHVHIYASKHKLPLRNRNTNGLVAHCLCCEDDCDKCWHLAAIRHAYRPVYDTTFLDSLWHWLQWFLMYL